MTLIDKSLMTYMVCVVSFSKLDSMHLLFYTSILLLLPLNSADLIPTSLTQWYSRADILHRHEYKHSFCAPKLTLGKDNRIPFWKYGGDSIATQDSLRIVPSIRSRQGYIWNEYKLTAQDWEVRLQ